MKRPAPETYCYTLANGAWFDEMYQYIPSPERLRRWSAYFQLIDRTQYA